MYEMAPSGHHDLQKVVTANNSTNISNNDQQTSASITATVLSLSNILVDTSSVTSAKISQADFSAVTCQLTFLQRSDDSYDEHYDEEQEKQEELEYFGEKKKKKKHLSAKSCLSHPLQLSSSQNTGNSKRKLYEARWYGMGTTKSSTAGAVIDLQKLEESNFGTLKAHAQAQNGVNTTHSTLNSSSLSSHNDHMYSSYEILVKLKRGSQRKGNEVFLGVVPSLQIPLEDPDRLEALAMKYCGTCRCLDGGDESRSSKFRRRFSVELHLPVQESNHHSSNVSTVSENDLKLKRTKSLSRALSFGRRRSRRQDERILNLVEFPNGDGRRYGIQLPSYSNGEVYGKNGCTLHLRLDVNLRPFSTNWVDDFDPNANTNNNRVTNAPNGKQEYITQSWDPSNDFATENQEVFDLQGFLPGSEHDFPMYDNNAFREYSSQQDWNELKELQQRIHLDNLKELSHHIAHENRHIHQNEPIRSDVLFGDISSIKTGQSDQLTAPTTKAKARTKKKRWTLTQLVEKITLFGGPCTSLAACADMNIDDNLSKYSDDSSNIDIKEGLVRMKNKAKKTFVKVAKNVNKNMNNMPKNEEEIRARIQKIGINCGVPNTGDGFDETPADMYTPHQYKHFPISTDSIDYDDSIFGSITDHTKPSHNVRRRLRKTGQTSAIPNILSTDSFGTTSDAQQSIESDIFDDLSSIGRENDNLSVDDSNAISIIDID